MSGDAGPGHALVLRRTDGHLVTPGADPDDRVSPATDQAYWRGIPETTQQVYRYQWNRFADWCARPENGSRSALPARPGTVREYIQAHWTWTVPVRDTEGREVGRKFPGRNGQRYSFETINLACKVINIVHEGFGYPSPTKNRDVKIQLRSYRQDWLDAGYVQDTAAALTPDEVLAMIATCDLTTVGGIRDALLMRLAYDVGRRNAEFMALNWSGIAWVDDRRMRITFPRGKTVKDGKPQTVAVEADDGKTIGEDGQPIPAWAPDTCPVLLTREWRELCATRELPVLGGAPVFREVRLGKRRKVGLSGVVGADRMTRQAFQDMVTMRAHAAGVDYDPVTREPRKVAPHSFRRSFARNGDEEHVPIHQLADRAGWSRTSPVILGYMQSAEKWGDDNPGVRMRHAAVERRNSKRAREAHEAAGASDKVE